MRDVLTVHEAVCPTPNPQRKLQLSCDGVQESLSTNITLDVYSVKFLNCKHVYPLRVVKPLQKGVIDNTLQLNLVVKDLYANNCKITQYIADSKKRSEGKLSLGHSSWFPCEYCFAKGTRIIINPAVKNKEKNQIALQKDIIQEKIDTLKNQGSQNGSEVRKLKLLEKELTKSEKKLQTRKSHIVWPKSSMNGPPRTREEISEIVLQIENNVPLTSDEAKGIVGRSILFDLPGFNFVTDVPVEYLHCVCLGVIKRSVELTFRVGESRSRITKRKLSLPSQFNSQIANIKVFREFNRRIRDLDFSVYKGQEFRNLLLFFFPLILNCIEPNAKERHMWLNLAYMIRACIVPTKEFQPIPLNVINRCAAAFYSLFQQLFGAINCSYNMHMVGSHLIEIRFHGPLTFTSAYPFESFYGELRNSFVPGTPSCLKQIMSNVFIKRAITNHRCRNEIYISPKNTSMECNNIIYCYEQQTYKIYVVNEIVGNILTCQKQETLECFFPETPSLKWGLVGVFKKGNLLDNPVQIQRKNVKGKVLNVLDYLITCPLNVLLEK